MEAADDQREAWVFWFLWLQDGKRFMAYKSNPELYQI